MTKKKNAITIQALQKQGLCTRISQYVSKKFGHIRENNYLCAQK